jgi:CDP-diglyceride synthetase
MTLLLQLVWLAVPILLTGLVHLAVMKRDWLPALRRTPLDGGASWRGKRVFGDNKTLRGAVVMICGTALAAWLVAKVAVGGLGWPVPIEFAGAHPAAWGALIGLGYIVGELPNSFIKRQLGIAPGAEGEGVRGRVFWVVDQLDSLVGILLAISAVWQPSLALVLVSIVLMLVLHPLSAWVMVLAGLKDRVG